MLNITIAEGLFTTGEMGRNIPEQSLVITTESGLVVITGCAHPGIVAIVEQARQMFEEPVRLVLGGFHLESKAEIDAILRDFRSGNRFALYQERIYGRRGKVTTRSFAF